MLNQLKTRKNLKALTAALTCGLVFTMGGQAEAEDPSLYGTGPSGSAYGDPSMVEGNASTTAPSPAVTTGADFTIKGGSWRGVYGGFSVNQGAAVVSGNKVTITGGIFSGLYYSIVMGGFAADSSGNVEANGNTVTINGIANSSEFSPIAVYGGRTYDNGNQTVNGNTVNIINSKINCDVAAGSLENAYSNVYTAKNNVINLENATLADNIIYGVYFDVSNKGTIIREGNTLNVRSTDNKVKNIGINTIGGVEYSSFQIMNFYIPGTAAKGDTMLTITYPTGLNMKGVTNVNVGVEQGTGLVVGDTINLIKATNGISNYEAKAGQITESEFMAYGADVALSSDNRALVATIREVTSAGSAEYENRKSPVETMAAGLTMLTSGGDMMAGEGMSNAAEAARAEGAAGNGNTMAPFAAIGGANSRIKSGSHVDLKAWNINLGFAKEIANRSGKLLIGPVVEYGRGSYDSYLDNGLHGNGKSSFMGVGVIAKQTNHNDFYYEGSLRGGRIKNDYASDSGSSYDMKSNYYAAHLGAGKVLQLKNNDNVDVYGKLFYTHQNGTDTTLAGYRLSLDAVDSFRTKLGARYNHKLNACSTLYGGLAWQYEFSGKAEATYNGDSTPSPSVKGSTGVLELGWKVKPGKGNFETGLGFTGSVGKQEGIGFNASFQWNF